MRGFIERSIPLMLRRLITLAPALAILAMIGLNLFLLQQVFLG